MSTQPLPPHRRRSTTVTSMPARSRLFSAILVLLVVIALAASGCGSKDNTTSPLGSTTTSAQETTCPSTPPAMIDEPGTRTSDVPTTEPATPNGLSRADVERWLAAPRFSYVGESDYDQSTKTKTGHLAFIDNKTDTVPWRPEAGRGGGDVAVSPDGTRIYLTDVIRPELYVFDADSQALVSTITIPGAEAMDEAGFAAKVQKGSAFPYSMMQRPVHDVAATPDGTRIIVCTSVGVQVIDAVSLKIVRSLPDLIAYSLVISFDGRRLYVGTDPFLAISAEHTLQEWSDLIDTGKAKLVVVDLATYDIIDQREVGVIGGMAMKPDGSEVYACDLSARAVRMIDTSTLEDLATVPVDEKPVTIGVLPNGTKAYGVVYGDVRRPGSFFAVVIDTATRKEIKRIPLDMY
jgi:YVTN family beta-propeller protein